MSKITSRYKIKKESEEDWVNIDPRFNIFTPDEIVVALVIYRDAVNNGGILCDEIEQIPDNKVSIPHSLRQIIIRKMKRAKMIEPTYKLLFEYQVQ